MLKTCKSTEMTLLDYLKKIIFVNIDTYKC